MVCKSCRDNVFRQKLGRCRRCMWINLGLLLGSALGWYLSYQSAPKHVATIALLLTLIASCVLMSLHIGAYLYYKSKGINPFESKEDR